MKKTRILLTALIMSAAMSFSALAAEWKQDTTGYWYQNDDGSYPVNQWQTIEGKMYYFGANGYMLTNTATPDGYQVGADGALIVNTGSQVNTPQLSTTTSTPTTVLGAGTYKVGTEITAGEYILFCTTSYGGYYEITSDSSGDFSSIILNGNFDYNAIIKVENGQYLNLSRCSLSPINEIPQIDYTKGNMFKVGYHIPAGEYKLQQSSEYDAYYCVLSNLNGKFFDIVANDNFEGQAYVTVMDGQYLEIDGCKIIK